MLYWVLDMYTLGYGHDCKFFGYASKCDPERCKVIKYIREDYDKYLDLAEFMLENKIFSGAFMNFSNAIKLKPKEAKGYYKRAIIKSELCMNSSALEDYNRAVKLAPDFPDAIVNRALLKVDLDDIKGALKDYAKALKLKSDNPMLYFNRGDLYYNQGKKDKACSDWAKAKELGYEDAQQRLDEYCN